MPSPSERHLLLLLDDQPEILSLLERLLASEGYDVVARTGGQAVVDECRAALAAGVRPAAALLDLSLPEGLSGEETAAQLQAMLPGLPCLAMSGLTREDLPESCAARFSGFIAKPFHFNTLLGTIEDTLRGTA